MIRVLFLYLQYLCLNPTLDRVVNQGDIGMKKYRNGVFVLLGLLAVSNVLAQVPPHTPSTATTEPSTPDSPRTPKTPDSSSSSSESSDSDDSSLEMTNHFQTVLHRVLDHEEENKAVCEKSGKGCVPEVNFIPPERSEGALKEILASIKKHISDNKCNPKKTLFAFDIDETVLVAKGNKTQEIRSSASILKEMQASGISTVALTIRPVMGQNANILDVVNWYKSQNMPLDKEFWFSNINFTIDDVRKAGIVLDQGIAPFKVGNVFYDLDGKKAAEGFFTLHSDTPLDFTKLKGTHDYLYYGNGVIMASGQSKGKVLQRFLKLKNLSNKYDCIFFADDQHSNIVAMERAYTGVPGKTAVIFEAPMPD